MDAGYLEFVHGDGYWYNGIEQWNEGSEQRQYPRRQNHNFFSSLESPCCVLCPEHISRGSLRRAMNAIKLFRFVTGI